ncbi:hypothetical protein AB0K51_12690 [Kitasatospora sp. NPDC049285]|uniref:hypothetical protein n=1 Tax=Kitasatospora sp. NPDC049285 TaxID=3157096 RepID=UPI003432794A
MTALLDRLTRMLLSASGEGATELAHAVGTVAAGYGGRCSMVLVPDGAALTVTLGDAARTVAVRAFPDVARLDKVAALKPWALDAAAGRLSIGAAERRLAAAIAVGLLLGAVLVQRPSPLPEG